MLNLKIMTTSPTSRLNQNIFTNASINEVSNNTPSATRKKGHNETVCIIATELSMLICLRLLALRPYISISLPL